MEFAQKVEAELKAHNRVLLSDGCIGKSSPVVGGTFPIRQAQTVNWTKVPTIRFSKDLFTFEQNAKITTYWGTRPSEGLRRFRLRFGLQPEQ
jgi:hypothetical protein